MSPNTVLTGIDAKAFIALGNANYESVLPLKGGTNKGGLQNMEATSLQALLLVRQGNDYSIVVQNGVSPHLVMAWSEQAAGKSPEYRLLSPLRQFLPSLA